MDDIARAGTMILEIHFIGSLTKAHPIYEYDLDH